MSIMEISSSELTAKLNRVAQAMSDTAPLTAAIAGSLATVTDDNFTAQGLDVSHRPLKTINDKACLMVVCCSCLVR